MVGRSIFKKLAVTVAVAAAGLAGATTAQASPTWTMTGDFMAQGELAVTSPATGRTIWCPVSIDGTAENVAGVAKATVNDVTASACWTNLANCGVVGTVNAPTSWTITVSGNAPPYRIELGSVSLGMAYTGSVCTSNRVSFSVTGSVGGNFVSAADGNESYVEFFNEPGLTSGFGNELVDGFLGLIPVAGGDLDLT